MARLATTTGTVTKKKATKAPRTGPAKPGLAYAIERDRSAHDTEAEHAVPRGHELIAAFPVPAELGFPARAGGVVVSIDRKRMWTDGVHALGVHRSVGVALVDAGDIETPAASGPAYEGESVPLKLVRFVDELAPKTSASKARHRASKVGGFPFHYNEPSPSSCTRCGQAVVWMGLLGPALFDATFGDSGALTIYVCPQGCEAQSAIDSA